ncbi:DMT family transporter [Streptomyces sp. TRM66268-LWL]|uniref:DMT family transporter n=1 Tax=Streptomyces polyasparticus TaxID=2767826 RepID=A0ABR7SIS4_9ACTN|nr:DMT family transporter [Streptomyces polyasparticus]MBC9715416.1 DMT family transporter [Streptomyces polyasparticus]
MTLPVLFFALGAACCLGFGFVLQQSAARSAPLGDFLSPRLLLDLVRMPRWLAGIALMSGGTALGAVALSWGEMSLVEPLLATHLLFAMALVRRLTGQRLGRQGWGGLLLLAGGVSAFLIAGHPEGSGASVSPLRHWLVVGAVLAAALALTAFARRFRLGVGPALLGAAGGLLYGLQDALTRTSGQLVVGERGVLGLLTAWQPYGVLVLGLAGLLLVQSAFEMAPLRSSLPALTAAQPLAGIVCGVGFLGDRLRTDAAALTVQAAGLLAIVAGIVLLCRHPAMPTGATAAQPVLAGAVKGG